MANQANRGGGLPFDPVQRAFELWERRWGASTSMLAVTSLMRAHQLVLAEVDAIVRPYDLTFARYEALVLLTFSRRGSLPLSKIGERLQVHPTSVTNIIDRLARSGLVERRPNPEDGRGVLAQITAQGRDVVEKATADLMAAQFGLGALDSGQHRTLFTVLRDLRHAAGDFDPAGDAGAAAFDDALLADAPADGDVPQDAALDGAALDGAALDGAALRDAALDGGVLGEGAH